MDDKQVRVTVSLDDKLSELIYRECQAKNVSASQVIREAVRAQLVPSGGPVAVQPSLSLSSDEGTDSQGGEGEEEPSDPIGQRLFRLPFGSEFTPRTIDSLSEVLELVKAHEGDLDQLQTSLRGKYFSDHSPANQETLAYNCTLSMREYGVVDKEGRLTPVGQALYAVREQPDALYRAFARHILTDRGGLQLLGAIRDETKAGRKLTLESIRPALEARGAYMPRGSKHVSTMRSWLQMAGTLDSGWIISEARVKEILGVSLDDVDVLAGLTDLQRLFLRALATLASETPPYRSNEVINAAEKISGVRFPEKAGQLKVIEPLVKAGLITASKTTAGRGSRAFEITPTEQFNAEMLEPILAQIERGAAPDLLRFLRMPLRSVLDALDAPTTHERGLALEALIIILMRLLGCHYLGTRVRGVSTGGAEVDALFESRGIAFVRWQVQCKNKERISTDDIAKEIGIAQALKAQAVVMITTGTILETARQFAQHVMENTNIAVYLLDEDDIRRIAADPSSIFGVFERESMATARLKRLAS